MPSGKQRFFFDMSPVRVRGPLWLVFREELKVCPLQEELKKAAVSTEVLWKKKASLVSLRKNDCSAAISAVAVKK